MLDINSGSFGAGKGRASMSFFDVLILLGMADRRNALGDPTGTEGAGD